MKVVLREFQRHMHRYLAMECVIYGTKGDIIGRWEPIKGRVTSKGKLDILEEEEV